MPAYLYVSQSANKVMDAFSGITHYQVERVLAKETGIHELKVWFTTEIPKVKGEPSSAEGEYVTASVLPLHQLQQGTCHVMSCDRGR